MTVRSDGDESGVIESTEPETPEADVVEAGDAPGTAEPAAAAMVAAAAAAGGEAPGKKGKKGKKAGKQGKKKAGGPGTTRGIETMFRTSYRTHLDLSSLADTKANIMISINGIIISIAVAGMAPGIEDNYWLFWPVSTLMLTCLTSLIFAVLAARPRISSRLVSLEDVRSNRANILFFGNFVNMPEEDYLIGMRELMANTDRLYTNMSRDIYSLGGVLAKKYALVRKAYTIFMVGLAASVLLFVVVLGLAAATQGFTVGG
jgi:hypothetical protein